MTPQQSVGLGVRLFAIWLAIISIRYFSSIPAAIIATHSTLNDRLYESYIVGGVYLIVAILLWFFPMTVAHRLIPQTSFNDKLSIEVVGAARVGCALVGLWIFAVNLKQVVWIFFVGVLAAGEGPTYLAISPENKVELAASLFECAFAIVLMIRSSLFAR